MRLGCQRFHCKFLFKHLLDGRHLLCRQRQLWQRLRASLWVAFKKGNKVTEEARNRVSERYDAYLADAVWLASQSPRDLDRCDRDELIRATLSVRLIGPDGSA